MNEIQITKIDGQEFVTYMDYLRLEEENKKLKEKLEKIKETYIRFEDSEKEYNKWLWELDQLIMNR